MTAVFRTQCKTFATDSSLIISVVLSYTKIHSILDVDLKDSQFEKLLVPILSQRVDLFNIFKNALKE